MKILGALLELPANYTHFLIDGHRIGLFRGAKNYDWVAGTWNPHYTPALDFGPWFFIIWNIQVKIYLMRGQTSFWVHRSWSLSCSNIGIFWQITCMVLLRPLRHKSQLKKRWSVQGLGCCCFSTGTLQGKECSQANPGIIQLRNRTMASWGRP